MHNLLQTLTGYVGSQTQDGSVTRHCATRKTRATSKLATERHLATKGYLATSDFADRTIITKTFGTFISRRVKCVRGTVSKK